MFEDSPPMIPAQASNTARLRKGQHGPHAALEKALQLGGLSDISHSDNFLSPRPSGSYPMNSDLNAL
jgi:hypothetical protein